MLPKKSGNVSRMKLFVSKNPEYIRSYIPKAVGHHGWPTKKIFRLCRF